MHFSRRNEVTVLRPTHAFIGTGCTSLEILTPSEVGIWVYAGHAGFAIRAITPTPKCAAGKKKPRIMAKNKGFYSIATSAADTLAPDFRPLPDTRFGTACTVKK